ncbi:MAG: polysaccharide biosynthesis C-terminal domain-containing protein, partial [Clostridia bacterium]|nr:polysaccharide biosynthesis C-terminal domain-containing protein [Clostridia bacterium]
SAKENGSNLSFAKINLSITISCLIIPFIMTFDSFVVINLLNLNFSEQISTALYGLQSGLVNSLINFPIIISMALSMSLLPSLTFLISKKKSTEVNEKMKEIFKTIWIIALPCIVVFIIFSDLIMQILYGVVSPQMLNIASTLLKISAMEILFISVLQVSIAIFQSFGKEKMPIFILVLCAIVKIILTLILVRNPNINIYGVALANLIFYALSASISLFLIKKKFKFCLDFKFFTVTLLSILISSIFFYEINVFIVNFWTKLSLIAITGIIFYIIPLFLFGIIDLEKLGLKKNNNLKIDKKL